MIRFLVLTITLVSSSAYADEIFDNRIYTPSLVVDLNNTGEKGAVQLLWQRSKGNPQYEIEVSSGKHTYNKVVDRHFHHIMVYFDKDYQWRVREVSSTEGPSPYSEWQPLKVLRSRRMASQAPTKFEQPVVEEVAEEPVEDSIEEPVPTEKLDPNGDVQQISIDQGGN